MSLTGHAPVAWQGPQRSAWTASFISRDSVRCDLYASCFQLRVKAPEGQEMEVSEMTHALVSIQTEYVEMPGLKLTLRQAQRLFNLSVDICHDALTGLLVGGFLSETKEGSFIRRGGIPLSIEALDLVARSSLMSRPARS